VGVWGNVCLGVCEGVSKNCTPTVTHSPTDDGLRTDHGLDDGGFVIFLFVLGPCLVSLILP
jgi:hypothetical protein